ncbi:MAG: hypothetical protein ABJG68_00605 [Crocinitomicaceae bacterium]
MKNILLGLLIVCASSSQAQVFNFGHQDLAFKNMLEHGICFLKTGDSIFDASMLDALDKYWKISDYTFVEQYKRAPKEMVALFVTTKTKTKKHVMDRKNQHILVLQPAALYKKDKTVPFNQTLGYMYYNGFYELLEEDEEYLFNRYIIQALNKGLTLIKEKKLHNKNDLMNENIAEAIVAEHKGNLGNTLILDREALVHFINIDHIKKMDITHRLHAKEEFFNALNTKSRTHYLLYYSVNTKTELSLINILTGEMIYTKHFEEGYTEIKAKEWKILAAYF